MFWGLNLKPNRKYTQTTSKSFHISQAALDSDSSEGGSNQIFISCENQKFLICTLRKDSCEQVMLDLNFAEGDEICFQSIGSGNVSLSGYLIQDSMNFLNGEDDEESEVGEIEEDLRNTLLKKAQAKKNKNAKQKAGSEEDGGEEDEEEDDEDEDEDEEDEDDDDDESEEEIDGDELEFEEEDEDSDDEDEDEEDEVQPPVAKQPKLDKSQKQQNGVSKESNADKKSKKDKKEKKQNQQQQQQQKSGEGAERLLNGGVKIVDVRVGTGPEAKNGKRVQVYYEGRLKSNNKVFDSLNKGNGFKFTVGRGEVIKAWEVGIVGMKVGGKRRITCPPHMAYGARGSPPTIPPNSVLIFDVELKGVN